MYKILVFILGNIPVFPGRRIRPDTSAIVHFNVMRINYELTSQHFTIGKVTMARLVLPRANFRRPLSGDNQSTVLIWRVTESGSLIRAVEANVDWDKLDVHDNIYFDIVPEVELWLKYPEKNFGLKVIKQFVC